MENARFRLETYKFTYASLNIKEGNDTLKLDFNPHGTFYPINKSYKLEFLFQAIEEISKENIVTVNCVAWFLFEDIDKLENIPDYFYANSIAILFPYIRAFVSTLTLQANMPPMVLPTLNLFPLQKILQQNTVVEE